MRAAVPIVIVALLAAGAVGAHGGEDHGAVPTPPTGGGDLRSTAASTSSVELVARWAAAAAGEPVLFRALLSDFDTNAPVEGAVVTLDLSEPGGGSLPSLTLTPSPSPGIYEGTVTPRLQATHAAAVTVVAGDLVDVVTLSAVDFGPPVIPAEAPHEHDDRPLALIVLAALLALALVAAIVALARRSRRTTPTTTTKAAATTTTALLLLALSPAALAHGGEDHAAPATTMTGPTSANTVLLPKESQFLLGIRTARVVTAPVADRLEVPGTVTAPPDRHAAIFAPQQGRVVVGDGGRALPLLGAAVKKGQLLAVLEAALSVGERASFSVEAAQASSEVAASTARVSAAQRNLTRLNSLEGVVSQRDRDDAAVELKQAEAALQAALGKQGAYGSTDRSTRIELRAPIHGVLADVDISPGELVEPGRRAFLVVDPTELWVEAKLYEGDLGRMTNEAGANISVDAWPGVTFPGVLMAVGEVVDPATRTVKAIFRVDNPQRRLKLGMFAHVQIGAGVTHDVLVVPDRAVLDVDGRRVVFVHTAPELFVSREVAVGRRDGDLVEVRGVQAGDRVVISGLLAVKNAPPAPAPATAPTPTAAPKTGSAPAPAVGR